MSVLMVLVFLFFNLYPCSPNNGFFQTETIDLSDQKSRSDRSRKFFRRSNLNKNSSIDSDGLPYVGQVSIRFWNFIFFCVFLVLYHVELR